MMKQPLLVILEVPDGTDVDSLESDVHDKLRFSEGRWCVLAAVAIHRTDGVPATAVLTEAGFSG